MAGLSCVVLPDLLGSSNHFSPSRQRNALPYLEIAAHAQLTQSRWGYTLGQELNFRWDDVC